MGFCKALLLLGGESLVHRAARMALAAGVDSCVVTVPPPPLQDDVIHAVDGLSVHIVANQRMEEGLIGSVRTVLECFAEPIEKLALLPVDCPLASVELLQQVLAAVNNEHVIAAPEREGHFGHPIAFGRAHIANLFSAMADRGARSLLKSAGAEIRTVPCNDDLAFANVNTVESLNRFGLQRPR
jgi:molybdenum cofactor cytidylyltransferase